jgi:hypothetical protein
MPSVNVTETLFPAAAAQVSNQVLPTISAAAVFNTLKHPQVPLLQLPPPQTLPHDPQLFGSVRKFVSQPLVRLASQSPKLALQTNPQLPPAHAAAALVRPGQALLQLLQLFGSLERLLHVPPQLVSPAWHETEQEPKLQTWPAEQTLPPLPPWQSLLAPQWLRSVPGSTQAPPQLICPPGQDTWQIPDVHTWPSAHTLPALPPRQSPVAPQCERSVPGSTHAPLQLTWPAGQDTWQVPPEQTWPDAHVAPALPPVQSLLAPQWSRSVEGSTQTPLQLMRPPWHESWQVPPAQTCPGEQMAPALPPLQSELAPQWARSVSGSMQVEAQLMSPVWQVSWQLPPTQTSPEPQAAPALTPWQSAEAPQCAPSFEGFTQVPPQLTRPVWQESWHDPLLQTWPEVHEVPAFPPVQSPTAPQ